MSKKLDLSSYQRWLRTEGYQRSTAEVSLRHMRTIATGAAVQSHQHPHIRRYLRFVEATGRNPLGREFLSKMKADGFEPSGPIAKAGKRSKPVLTRPQWSQLRSKLRRDGDEIDRLLIAYMYSPYRIAEFLELWVRGLDADDVSDALSREWIAAAFDNTRNKKLFMILCDTRRCAYSRMRRRLQRVTAKLGIEADLDTLYKSYHQLYGKKAA